MEKKPIAVLHPDYYTKFSCIGPACEDHCCKGWSIYIDKSTYKKYKRISDPELAKVMNKGVQTLKGRNEQNFAKFVLNADMVCPFYDEDKLCMIQKKLGETMLCTTCQQYPRLNRMTRMGQVELSMYATCPEMVRVALLPKEPMTFSISEFQADGSEFYLKGTYADLTNPSYFGETGKHAWEIREACIDILQCRTLPVRDRIFVVGMLLNRITELEAEKEFDKMPSVAAAYVAKTLDGDFADIMKPFAENPDRQAGMQSILLNHIMLTGALRSRQFPLYTQFIEKITGWMTAEQLEESNYSQMYGHISTLIQQYWPPFLAKWEHVLENYFVNLLFSLQGLFKHPALTPYQHFITLAEQYSMMRMLLCVLAEEKGEVDEALLTGIITTQANEAMHSDTAKRIIDNYAANGNDTLAQMAFLLQ
ncbi:flagellin lysine-N-methylase [Ruminococcaceae bacterium OttesenSCG-928-L11]|nr:flagellin lysine-N-methylase [Ruminococcaceae bacterium OttesenSCG-928-L11]